MWRTWTRADAKLKRHPSALWCAITFRQGLDELWSWSLLVAVLLYKTTTWVFIRCCYFMCYDSFVILSQLCENRMQYHNCWFFNTSDCVFIEIRFNHLNIVISFMLIYKVDNMHSYCMWLGKHHVLFIHVLKLLEYIWTIDYFCPFMFIWFFFLRLHEVWFVCDFKSQASDHTTERENLYFKK